MTVSYSGSDLDTPRLGGIANVVVEVGSLGAVSPAGSRQSPWSGGLRAKPPEAENFSLHK